MEKETRFLIIELLIDAGYNLFFWPIHQPHPKSMVLGDSGARPFCHVKRLALLLAILYTPTSVFIGGLKLLFGAEQPSFSLVETKPTFSSHLLGELLGFRLDSESFQQWAVHRLEDDVGFGPCEVDQAEAWPAGLILRRANDSVHRRTQVARAQKLKRVGYIDLKFDAHTSEFFFSISWNGNLMY